MRQAREAAKLLALAPIEPVPRMPREQQLSGAGQSLLRRYLRSYGLPEDHRFAYIQIRGYIVALHRWLPKNDPPRGLAILSHGYQSHTGLLGRLIKSLRDAGYAVAAADLPGHGLSTGPRGAVDLVADYRRVFGAAYRAFTLRDEPLRGLPVALIGTSTGCTVMTDWLLSGAPAPPPGKAVFLSPLIRPRLWPLLLPVEPLGRAIVGFQRIRGRRARERTHTPSREPEGVERLVNLGIPPAGTTRNGDHARFIRTEDPLYARRVDLRYLAAISSWSRYLKKEIGNRSEGRGSRWIASRLTIIQGTGDKLVSFRQNLELFRALAPEASVQLIPGAHHDLLHDAEPVPSAAIRLIFDAL